MKLVFKQIKVYARLVVLVGMAMVVTAVVIKNADNKVTVWFFRPYESIPVLWLILFTSVGSVLSWWILTATLGVWRDMRELHRASELEQARADQVQRAKEMAETEERIDRKLKEAISDEEPGAANDAR